MALMLAQAKAHIPVVFDDLEVTP
jgi:hypothetical protein